MTLPGPHVAPVILEESAEYKRDKEKKGTIQQIL
jgi:hypothetical protein